MSHRWSCKLIVDPPLPGAWNMAVDEMLLDWSAEQGGCCWRFYEWSEPTVSLGYFQPYAGRWQHAASGACAAVRRLTGGGAIVHDRELTYSVVLPSSHPLAVDRDALYEAAHATLIEVLGHWGIEALMHPGNGVAAADEPFLCFQRRAPGDVVVGHTKITGSAQRRRRGAVLQHGSVLLHRSLSAPELAGLGELIEPAVEPVLGSEQLQQAWLPRLAQRLGVEWEKAGSSEFPNDMFPRRMIEELQSGKYATAAWTERRGR